MTDERRLRGTLNVAAGLAVGLGPGLILPFVVALYFEPEESDAALIALSVSLLMVNVVVAASEASSISTLGSRVSLGAAGSSSDLWAIARRNLSTSVPVIGVISPVLAAAYALQVDDPWPLVVAIAILMVVPIVGVVAASFSAALIVEGKSPVAVASQGLRSIVPLAAMLLPTQITVVGLVTLYAAGELLRLAILWILRVWKSTGSKATPGQGAIHGRPEMLWQFGASAATQSNATVDRLFLSGAGAGNVTAYDLGEKIAYAVFQLMYSVRILHLLSRWSVDYSASGQGGRTELARDLRSLLGQTAFLAALLGTACGALLAFVDVPKAWELGLLWSLISLISMPFAVAISALMRLLVIRGTARAMFRGATFGLGVNVLLDALFLLAMGPVGVVVAGVFTRAITAFYLFRAAMASFR